MRPASQPAGAARAGEAWSESDLPETEAEPPRGARPGGELATFDFQARLAVRARSYLGRRGPFSAKGQRFGSDCSGFVEAVYAAEGLMLRELMQRAAPDERSGVAAAWYAARAGGRLLGPREWPAPGDLVFWRDTYDRNRNGRADDRFTHLGIVEYVENGTVFFLHRGGKGVARGVMTPGRPYEVSDADGRRLNSPLRATTHPVKDGGGLAGELLEGYGRIDPDRVPPEYASGRIDPFYGPASDREPPAAATVYRPTAAATDTVTSTAVLPERSAAAEAAARTRRAPAPARPAPTAAKGPAAPTHLASAGKPPSRVAAKRVTPGKKTRVKKAPTKHKALARIRPAAPKGRVAAKTAPAAAAQRAETAGRGAESAPSSETDTAAAPKSSSESRRTTGMAAPAGSR